MQVLRTPDDRFEDLPDLDVALTCPLLGVRNR